MPLRSAHFPIQTSFTQGKRRTLPRGYPLSLTGHNQMVLMNARHFYHSFAVRLHAKKRGMRLPGR